MDKTNKKSHISPQKVIHSINLTNSLSGISFDESKPSSRRIQESNLKIMEESKDDLIPPS